jgi:hypothetical protein
MAKDKDKQEKPVKLDPDALRAEVKAFAAELGFGSGSIGAFEYDDFAPEKAAKKIKPAADVAKQTAKQQQQQQSGKGHRETARFDKAAAYPKPPQQQERGGKQKHGREQQQQQQQQEPLQLLSRQEQNLDIVRSRTWVESVGPRPGTAL